MRSRVFSLIGYGGGFFLCLESFAEIMELLEFRVLAGHEHIQAVHAAEFHNQAIGDDTPYDHVSWGDVYGRVDDHRRSSILPFIPPPGTNAL